jgi:hypothetical protein
MRCAQLVQFIGKESRQVAVGRGDIDTQAQVGSIEIQRRAQQIQHGKRKQAEAQNDGAEHKSQTPNRLKPRDSASDKRQSRDC